LTASNENRQAKCGCDWSVSRAAVASVLGLSHIASKSRSVHFFSRWPQQGGTHVAHEVFVVSQRRQNGVESPFILAIFDRRKPDQQVSLAFDIVGEMALH